MSTMLLLCSEGLNLDPRPVWLLSDGCFPLIQWPPSTKNWFSDNGLTHILTHSTFSPIFAHVHPRPHTAFPTTAP